MGAPWVTPGRVGAQTQVLWVLLVSHLVVWVLHGLPLVLWVLHGQPLVLRVPIEFCENRSALVESVMKFVCSKMIGTFKDKSSRTSPAVRQELLSWNIVYMRRRPEPGTGRQIVIEKLVANFCSS